MKYPEDFINKLICAGCPGGMRNIPTGSIDLMATDPPYGYSFMGRDWDKALVGVRAWKECLRVLKPGAFAFIMCAPRQDVLSRQIINLEDAGFITGFSSIYWAYASGFPKAQNISKTIDKRECTERLIRELERKPTDKEFKEAWNRSGTTGIIRKGAGKNPKGLKFDDEKQSGGHLKSKYLERNAISSQAKLLNGSYGGFQPKPAVEVILVVMKPLSEKTYMEQALKDRKGVTWLDGGRLPYKSKGDFKENWRINKAGKIKKDKFLGDLPNSKMIQQTNPRGRFPANLLVSNDVLNDGRNSKGSHNQIFITEKTSKFGCSGSQIGFNNGYNDSGSFSRYFDLDKWWEEKIKHLPESVQKTFPFLIVPKASKAEKNKGCGRLEEKVRADINKMMGEAGNFKTGSGNIRTVKFKNHHPTVKPIKLMSYLIILGSRPNDIILDPFVGSGTTCIAAKMLGRKYIGFDDDEGYIEIAQCRLGGVEAVLI
jgi:site-specific DNA-methyltransferase (adenine-specific)